MDLLDLTLEISHALPTFPGSPRPRMIPWSSISGDGYNSEMLFLSSHAGTHMDAPYHFAEDGIRIHQIPMERLSGEAILIKLEKGANQRITPDDIVSHEKVHGPVPRGAAVVFRTGWQSRLYGADYFTKNPGLSAEAAEHLVERGVSLVGTDSPSIDVGEERAFPAHRILARNGVINVENLANLDRIKSDTFPFIILPLKLVDATGSPVRAVAVQ